MYNGAVQPLVSHRQNRFLKVPLIIDEKYVYDASVMDLHILLMPIKF